MARVKLEHERVPDLSTGQSCKRLFEQDLERRWSLRKRQENAQGGVLSWGSSTAAAPEGDGTNTTF